MKILVLSFYCNPDQTAGAFRINSFIDELKNQISDSDIIDVITTMPNRYHEYSKEALEAETNGNLTIKRISLPKHKSGMLDQSLAFSIYAFNVFKEVRGEKYDLVFATSSRLFTAFLGSIIAKRKKAQCYLDIRDIFTDTLSDVLENKLLKKTLLPILVSIEKFTINSASKVNLVSKGFKEYFQQRRPDCEYSYYTNGIDETFLKNNFEKSDVTEKKIILYAGNIGEGQGLDKILPGFARLVKNSANIHVYGAGGTKDRLLEALKSSGVNNVLIFDPVDREKLIKVYQNADVLFLHLNDYDAFKKVLPSKIFEYGATGKPMLAGVGGYAKAFIEENVVNAKVFTPCDAHDCLEKYNQLELREMARSDFIKKFTRTNIMKLLVSDFLSLRVNNSTNKTCNHESSILNK